MSTIRETKYTKQILLVLEELGHATNAQIANALRKKYPELSDTTVHRATNRLLARGSIGEAPVSEDGSMRFDANTRPHDHFMCAHCDRIRDLEIAKDCLPLIENQLGGCKITGRLVINGSCEKCINKGGNT